MLSIIIPVLNEEDYLPRLLKSIKAQTFRDYEIVVADAGSTDRTLDFAKKYNCKVVPGGLPAKGRNEGAKAAGGNLLLFLDADVQLAPKDFLKRALREFRERNLDIASCQLLPLPTRKRVNREMLKTPFDLANYFMITFENIAPFGVGSMILAKKDFHQKIDGFKEDVQLGEDTLYIRKAARHGKFGILRSVKILWSIRRFEKEKWIKPILSYILCWFLIGLDEKRLSIFQKGLWKYYFAHYGEPKKSAKANFPNVDDFKKMMNTKIL